MFCGQRAIAAAVGVQQATLTWTKQSWQASAASTVEARTAADST